MTDEARKNMSEAHKGQVPWSKGKKLTDEHKMNISSALKGRIISPEWREKMSNSLKRAWREGRKTGHKLSEETKLRLSWINEGDGSPNWKGGVTPENQLIRQRIEYRLWREAVFARDNWTCQKCRKRGGKLVAHHIKYFSEYPESRFAIDNGITLCKECHKLFHKSGS
mgnify:CR=1 FL=1